MMIDHRAPASASTHRQRVLRLGGTIALPVTLRSVWIGLALLVTVMAASVATLTIGRLSIPIAELPAALLGGADGKEEFVLERLRGPRLSVAMGTGAALGLAGALFQSVSRNPLGSPDVIGVGAGAGAGAALFGLLAPGVLPVPIGALAGGAVATVLVYISTGTGFRNPGRLIVAGIGIAAMSTAFTHYVVYVAARERASVLSAYLNGTLVARSWEHAATIWLALAVLVPVVIALSRRVAVTEMGDDLAAGLGARPYASRTGAIVLSVMLSSAAVSVAGPIAFVALTAPNVAKRLAASAGPSLTLSALVGALLMVVADLIAERIPLGDGLPVGIFTMAIGGLYLGHLLILEWRKGAL